MGESIATLFDPARINDTVSDGTRKTEEFFDAKSAGTGDSFYDTVNCTDDTDVLLEMATMCRLKLDYISLTSRRCVATNPYSSWFSDAEEPSSLDLLLFYSRIRLNLVSAKDSHDLKCDIPLLFIGISEKQYSYFSSTITKLRLELGILKGEKGSSTDESSAGNPPNIEMSLKEPNNPIAADFRADASLSHFALVLFNGDSGLNAKELRNDRLIERISACAADLCFQLSFVSLEADIRSSDIVTPCVVGDAGCSIQSINLQTHGKECIVLMDNEGNEPFFCLEAKFKPTIEDDMNKSELDFQGAMEPIRFYAFDCLAILAKLKFQNSLSESTHFKNTGDRRIQEADVTGSSSQRKVEEENENFLSKYLTLKGCIASKNTEILLSPSDHNSGLCLKFETRILCETVAEIPKVNISVANIRIMKCLLANRIPSFLRNSYLVYPFTIQAEAAFESSDTVSYDIIVSVIKMRISRGEYALVMIATDIAGPDFDAGDNEAGTQSLETRVDTDFDKKVVSTCSCAKVRVEGIEILFYSDWFSHNPPILEVKFPSVLLDAASYQRFDRTHIHASGTVSFVVNSWNGETDSWDPLVENW